MADHHVPPMSPAQHRAYFLTRVRLSSVDLAVDLENARRDGVTTEQLAAWLRISPQTLLALEEGLNSD
jgi:hypothetical protein